jgi:hypothetical protein
MNKYYAPTVGGMLHMHRSTTTSKKPLAIESYIKETVLRPPKMNAKASKTFRPVELFGMVKIVAFGLYIFTVYVLYVERSLIQFVSVKNE